MNTEPPISAHSPAHASHALTGESAPLAEPMHQMVRLMSRLLEEPEAEALLVPQLLKLSETLPDGATRGALENSVAAMARLRGWLQQLQARQRLTTRFNEITARLSRVEGLSALMQALADEAQLMLDAPLARLDVFPPLVVSPGDATVNAHSGSFISRMPQHRLLPTEGLAGVLARLGGPLVLPEGLGDAHRQEAPEFEAIARQEGLQGFLAVPLTTDGNCCGLIWVGDRMIRHWSVMDVDALQQLALVAVRAIGRVARADMAQHTLLALHERQRLMRLQLDRGVGFGAVHTLPSAGGTPAADGHQPLALLLEPVASAVRDAYVERCIGALRRADHSRGTSLTMTLLTYLDQGHNARAAARVLGVHVNTLHNRLETIGTLLPGWDAPGSTLEVHLALRLMAEAAGPGAYPRSN